MLSVPRSRTVSEMPADTPKYRPLERFWPYADLPEQPTEEELIALDPDLQEALFGPTPRPFSITLVFPPFASKSGSAYQRFIPRNEMDIAVVGAGSWVKLNGDKIEAARVSVGAVAATPKCAQEASDWLAGKPATEATFAQAGELAKKVASPINDMRGTIRL